MTDPLVQREIAKAKAFIATQEGWLKRNWKGVLVGALIVAIPLAVLKACT